ncbi:MAG: pitrilysin family protein [Gemmatimonadetes bacterium]|nr:pitrilysin family protein [Gemmatimonadota bacterium]
MRRASVVRLIVLAVTPFALAVANAQQAPPTTQAVVLKGRAPVSDKVLGVKLPRPREGTLANGVHLIVLEDHRAPQVTFSLQIPGAGGYFDPAGQTGLATVTAAMMREGTTTRTTVQISEQLETMAAGLSVNTGTSSLNATVSGSALTEHVDKLFDMAADLLLHPTFPEEEFVKYRQRSLAGLNQQRSNPGFLAQELWSKVMFGDHPAGRISMTSASLGAFTREQLVEFHKTRYVPDNAVIAMSGDITYAAAQKLVESRLGTWAKTGTPMPMASDPAAAGPGKVYLVDRPNSVQTNFMVGVQAISRTDPDYNVMELMNAVVGGGPTGRLFTHLREEKGYTYGAYSGLQAESFKGTWFAQTDVRSEVTEPALTDLMEELRLIRDVPVSSKELQDKKRSLVASFALSLESPQRVLNYYVTSWTYKLPADYWDKYPARVMGVTSKQVQAAANKYLDPSKVQIIAVGDGKQVAAALGKFGPLETYDTEGKKITAIVP